MPFRAAEKAGSWYPATARSLEALLQDCLQEPQVEIPPGEPLAAVVPHAGLSFSGLTAGRAFRCLQPVAPDRVLIFGAVHTTALTAPAIWPEGDWQTPLGNVEVDAELAAALVENGVGEANPRPHYGDNAIELQMPFIRYCFPEAKIVPIATPPQEGVEQAGRRAWETAAAAGHKTIAIGSTDLTHYGASFAWTPKGTGREALEFARANDRQLLDLMVNQQADRIVPTAREQHSACGAGAAAATVAFAAAGGARGVLLEQTTSYDIMPQGEASHFVGYGSVLFVRE
jgi:AmmeMemoRadiSam system protein B